MTPGFIPTRTLEQVLSTEQLKSRPPRPWNETSIHAAVMRLTKRMAESPNEVLQMLAEEALVLCKAHTVGISVIEKNDDGEVVFKWRGLTGKLAYGKGMSMPRRPSPCGMVVDQQTNFLMSYPELHFQFPGPIDPPIVEVMLTPFFHEEKPVGTIWIVAHDDQRKFDNADLYAITALGRFASSAYALLLSLGYLQAGYEDGRMTIVVPTGRPRAPQPN
jgi:hypothetical protein